MFFFAEANFHILVDPTEASLLKLNLQPRYSAVIIRNSLSSFTWKLDWYQH